jgi:Zn-dependent M32 family carboxypeptidase
LLGAEPRTKGEGPLQNPDWFTGRFGFIATNTLSHMMAAQIHEKLFTEDKLLIDHIREGDFDKLGVYLRDNVPSQGAHRRAAHPASGADGRGVVGKNIC